jgi:hypothetical protein
LALNISPIPKSTLHAKRIGDTVNDTVIGETGDSDTFIAILTTLVKCVIKIKNATQKLKKKQTNI